MGTIVSTAPGSYRGPRSLCPADGNPVSPKPQRLGAPSPVTHWQHPYVSGASLVNVTVDAGLDGISHQSALACVLLVFNLVNLNEWDQAQKVGDVTDILDKSIGKKVYRIRGELCRDQETKLDVHLLLRP
jgi:hypothetical protein